MTKIASISKVQRDDENDYHGELRRHDECQGRLQLDCASNEQKVLLLYESIGGCASYRNQMTEIDEFGNGQSCGTSERLAFGSDVDEFIVWYATSMLGAVE